MIQFHSFGLRKPQRHSCSGKIDYRESSADNKQAGVTDDEVGRDEGSESGETAAHAVSSGSHLCGIWCVCVCVQRVVEDERVCMYVCM